MTLTSTRTPPRVYVILFVGVIAASLAAIFIRFAQADGMPSTVIAAGRMTLSGLILTPVVLRKHRADLARLSRRDLLLAVASGLLLAIHFATWIASLEYTTVLISVVLVGTSPLWSALFEVVFLHVRLHRFVVIGLLIAFVGGIVIGLAGGDSGSSEGTLIGGILSLVGAATFAIYLVIGRSLRTRMPLTPYIWLVYSISALFLLVLMFASGAPVTGYSSNAWLMVLLLAVVPQLIGHSSFNYAVRFLSATFVGIAVQLEPIGSAIAAYLIFDEVPLPLQIVGSIAILIGVIIASFGDDSKPPD